MTIFGKWKCTGQVQEIIFRNKIFSVLSLFLNYSIYCANTADGIAIQRLKALWFIYHWQKISECYMYAVEFSLVLKHSPFNLQFYNLLLHMKYWSMSVITHALQLLTLITADNLLSSRNNLNKLHHLTSCVFFTKVIVFSIQISSKFAPMI